jgi:hypothetical protein
MQWLPFRTALHHARAQLCCISTGTGTATGTLLNVHAVTALINICLNLVMLHSIYQYLYIQHVAPRHLRQACMTLTTSPST